MTHVNVSKNKCGAGSTQLPQFLIPSKAYADKWRRLPVFVVGVTPSLQWDCSPYQGDTISLK